MIAIISGKIVHAWQVNPNTWLFKLKQYFNSFGAAPVTWEIFGGNAFLLKVRNPAEALWIAFCIKAIFRQIPLLDISLSVTIGTEDTEGKTLRTSTGNIYSQTHWETEDPIPKQALFTLSSPSEPFDRQLNLLLEFALINMNSWSMAEAEMAELCIVFPEKNQQEIADWLQIKQSAVSQRKKRAHFDLIQKLNEYYKQLFHQTFD
ncbi:hypothetical protein DBR32_01240 [Taibaiella sp. KBW10]|uniref:hypothetical protein n=1 Tax=Taibaiella sp. KBW10 TaxID=2153357 RepID=UPI000F5A72B1|nr:hypothetical protein [Taibaiella sp. KBW10]RQO32262.1 hypothetical protein DBR32_01240 [Taibaiella sp. KBW10]